MRFAAVTALWLGIASPRAAVGQDTAIVIHPESSGVSLEQRELPRLVAEEVLRLFNAPSTTRLVGRTRLPKGNEWRGDVAVRNGPVFLGGRIQGSLLVINGDVVFEPGSEITGTLLVVGGAADSAGQARIGGEVRVYREPLMYRLEGDELVYAPNVRRRFPSLGARRSWGTADSRSTLTIATGGTFNRVEGLPVVFGPLFDWKVETGLRFRLDALGVFRTAGDLSDRRSDLGYMLRTEVRRGGGETQALGVGFRAFDVVAPVEDWGLHNAEVGWSAFLFRRDYRDYYLNKGAAGRLFYQPERQLSFSLEVRREWQTSVTARDPWTLFRSDRVWRANPPIDDGHYATLAGAVTLDSRNDPDTPTSGWLVRLQVERSRSRDVSPQTGIPAFVRDPIPTDGSYAFGRGFVDVRQYARVSPSGRLNLRLVGGGWLGGDPLPLQRRLSLGGPDPLTGYAFRASACSATIIDPAFAGTAIAACDRVLVFQAEYRGHIKLTWAYGASGAGAEGEEEPGAGSESLFRLEGPDLVVFGNAGQAWLVGNGPGHVPSDRIPTIGSWLADFGLGIDWGGFGVYLAKAVTVGEPLRFTLRLDHRF
ncbi:MAG: BamA/TamA family outer membrane protein [Gemmatimonadales bacterium]